MREIATGQGSNSALVREFNERVILSTLRRLGAASKADLARHANLTNNTAGVIVRELAAQHLIRTEGKRSGQRGQPATLLSLDAEGAYAIGVKIGRRTLDTLLVDLCGRVIERRHHACPFPLPTETLAIVSRDVERILAGMSVTGRARLAGLGVATPFHMGHWRRELDIPSAAYEDWEGFDVSGQLAAATGLDVVHENDGTAAAVAELFEGHGRQLDDFLYVFIGAAIGGGVVLGGNYLRGSAGTAGDIGLMPVGPSKLETAPAPTGPFDILLTRASINSLLRHLRSSGVAFDDPPELEALVAAHPDPVEAWIDDAVDALVAPLLAATCILDVPAIVIDGALPRATLETLIDKLARALPAAAPRGRALPELRVGSVGAEAAAIGAAILPLHQNFSPNRETLFRQ